MVSASRSCHSMANELRRMKSGRQEAAANAIPGAKHEELGRANAIAFSEDSLVQIWSKFAV